jgi:hypothetical protein
VCEGVLGFELGKHCTTFAWVGLELLPPPSEEQGLQTCTTIPGLWIIFVSQIEKKIKEIATHMEFEKVMFLALAQI